MLCQNYPIIYGVLSRNGYWIKWPTEASRIHMTSFLGAKLIELQKKLILDDSSDLPEFEKKTQTFQQN